MAISQQTKATMIAKRSAVASAVSLVLVSGLASAQQEKKMVTEAVDEVVVEGHSHRTEVSSNKFTAPLLDAPKSATISRLISDTIPATV
jgi:outer membrane receptor for monomeric catechols